MQKGRCGWLGGVWGRFGVEGGLQTHTRAVQKTLVFWPFQGTPAAGCPPAPHTLKATHRHTAQACTCTFVGEEAERHAEGDAPRSRHRTAGEAKYELRILHLPANRYRCRHGSVVRGSAHGAACVFVARGLHPNPASQVHSPLGKREMHSRQLAKRQLAVNSLLRYGL